MSIVQKAGASIDLDRYRLRRFVEEAAQAGQVRIVDEPTDLADVAACFEGEERAVLFRKTGPEGAELVGNVNGARARLALAFGCKPEGLTHEIMRRLGN